MQEANAKKNLVSATGKWRNMQYKMDMHESVWEQLGTGMEFGAIKDGIWQCSFPGAPGDPPERIAPANRRFTHSRHYDTSVLRHSMLM